MSRPEIVMQTPAAKKLEAEVQRKLAEYSYSTADDVVMAEYVVVMLANAKTPDQITAELSELIGEDMYDPAFTTWLFEEVARQYGIPQANSTSHPPPSPPETQETSIGTNNPSHDTGDKIQTVNDSRDHHMNYNNRPGPIKRTVHPSHPNRPNNHPNNRLNQPGVFNQALVGIKRSGPNDIIRETPPHRRLRQDDFSPAPYQTGTHSLDRNSRDPLWSNGVMSDRRDLPNGQRLPGNFPIGHPMGADSAAKSILERVGVSVNPNHQFQNSGFPPFGRPNDLGHNGTQPSQQQLFYGSPSSYPLPILPPHSFPQQPFNPHNSPNGPTPQLFLANGQPYVPPHPFQVPGSGPSHMYPYPGMQHQSPNQSKKTPGSSAAPSDVNQLSLEKRVAPAQPSESTMGPLPSVPLLREECKYNLACKNAWCPSSHCSPKGHPKSSMLLSFYPCELQLKCTDPECLKAHVSPQQADPKSSIRLTSASSKQGAQPGSMGFGPTARPPGSTANSKSIPCRFGSQCSRTDCVFSHPWILNNGVDRSFADDTASKNGFGGGIPCKFGLQCTRPDCFYQHPSSQRVPSKNISKSFVNLNTNKPSEQPGSAGIGSGGGSIGMGGLGSTEGLTPSKKFSAPGPAAPPTTNGAAQQDGASATPQPANGTLPSASADAKDVVQEAEKQVKVAALETHPSNGNDISPSDPAVAPANHPIKPAASTPIPAGV